MQANHLNDLALDRLRKPLGQLYLLKLTQGLLGIIWLILFGATLDLRWRGLSNPVIPFLVPIPFVIGMLALLQAWQSNKTLDYYNTIKNRLIKDEIEVNRRTQALNLLHAYQNYSTPPLIRGEASKSFTITLLLLGFICSVVTIILL